MPAFGIVIIHYHRINAKFNNRWLRDPQTPDEQILQKATKNINSDERKSFEKSLDHMRRGHLILICLYASGIATIFLKMIKVDQMSTGTIHQKAKHLFEKLGYFNSFLALSNGSEHFVQQGKNLDGMQVGYEKSQARPPCQFFVGGLNATDFMFLFAIFFAIVCHIVLHLMGYVFWNCFVIGLSNYTRSLPKGGELFFIKNRSI
jgi:hypothetical protein